MSQAVEQLNSLYQYLQRLYPQAQALLSTGRFQLACEQIAPKFCQLYQQQPALLHAQLALSSAAHPPLANLAMKQAVLILTLAQHGRWPLTLQEQLLSASFAALSGLTPDMFSKDFAQPQLLQDPWLLTVRRHQQQLPAVWLQLFASCCRLRQQVPIWQQNPLAAVMVLVYQLSYPLVQPATAGKIGFETLFRQQWRQATPLNQQLLTLLSHSGAALHQLGRFCSDSIGVVAFITDAAPDLKGYLFDLNLKSLSATPTDLAGSGLQLLPPKTCHDPAWLALLVRHAQDVLETADPEPMSLALIQQLNPDWPVSRQVSFLQSHPAFCQLLCQAASQLSRQQNAITDVRHALALIGTEQLPLLLRQSWLAQQTALCAQPWREWFRELEQVFQQALALLAQQTKTLDLSLQQTRLLAACVSLQLQQHDELRHQPLYRDARPAQSLASECRKLLWQEPDSLQQIAQLLAATGFGLLWQDAVLHFRSLVGLQSDYSQQQSAQLFIQFGWTLTELYFFGSTTTPAQLEALYKNARHALDLPAIPLSDWLQQLTQHCAAFWPLQPKL
jgi:hypothetical protein